MNKWISILGGVLVAQLVLAVAVNVSDEDYGAFEAKEKLLGFDKQKVDRLLIEDDKASVTLKKSGGKWVLSDEGDFPASQKSVSELLDKLAGLEKGWPVATTSGASRRFKVSEDDYERRLILYSGDEVLDKLYIGTSPGFRKVHLRPDDEEAVFVAEFNTWEADAKDDAWLDKDLLVLDESDLQQVELTGDITLQRDEGDMRLTDLAEKESTNDTEARTLIGKLTGLRIQALESEEESAKYKQQKPKFDIKVTLKDGKQLSYQFFEVENESYYILKRSDMDRYFEVASYLVDPLKDVSREKLVVVNESQPTAAPGIKTSQHATK